MPAFKRVRVWRGVRSSNPKRWVRGWGWKRIPTWRVEIREAMDWMLKHEPMIHYRQDRPIPFTQVAARTLPIRTDCSGSTTMLYLDAGRPDPNGKRYNGQGFTGTLRAHTPRTTLAAAKTGDMIIYGSGTGSHVVIVYTPHKTDPLVFSHGQEDGPRLYRHSVEDAAHAGSFTVHNGDAL